LGIYFSRFHHGSSGVERVHTNHGGGGSLFENGSLYSPNRKVTAKDAVTAFLREVWKLHGLPELIIFD
jgi:hypothetical protein